MSRKEIKNHLTSALNNIDSAKSDALEYIALLGSNPQEKRQPFIKFTDTNRKWASVIIFVLFLVALLHFYIINFSDGSVSEFIWLLIWSIFGLALAAFTSAQNTNSGDQGLEKTRSEFLVRYFIYFASLVIASLIIFLLVKRFVLDSFSPRVYYNTFWLVGIFIGYNVENIPQSLLSARR